MWLNPRSALLTLLLFCCTLFAFAQDTTIDSLRATVQSSAKDETKLKAYVLLTGKLSLISFNETIRIGDEGLQLAAKLNDSLAYAELNRYIGLANYFKGDYEKAAASYYIAAGVYERSGDQKAVAYVYNDIAKLYRKTRDLKRAAENYEKALLVFRALNDSSGIQMVMNESGVVYEYQGNLEEAIRRYKASLQIAENLKDEAGKGWSLSFLAGVYKMQSKFLLAVY